MWKNKILTIPNLLSMFRVILAGIYLVIYLMWGMEAKRQIMIGILILSAVSDFLDGKIARKFNMISELGKILDPIADKLTQGVLLICFLSRYEMAKYVLILMIFKEAYMAIIGWKTVRLVGENEGAKWYGKVSTTIFYVVMISLVLFPKIPQGIAEGAIVVCGCFMLISLILYARYYAKLRKEYWKNLGRGK